MSDRLTVLVMAAGAIGSVVGGLLARRGHRVALVGRPGHMAAIRERGLAISGIWGDHRITDLLCCASPADLPELPFDLVLLCPKTYDTASALAAALPHLPPQTLVVSLQNGLGNLETIAAMVGNERTAGARVIFGADLLGPGSVRVTVYGGEVLLGHPDGREPDPLLARLAAALNDAGLPAATTRELPRHLWGKVLYNASLNPLSALLDVPYGALLEREPTRAVMTQIVAEAFAVARAEGVELFWDSADGFLRTLFNDLIPPTAAHYASMHADLRRGGRTEIAALNGALVRFGAAHGIPTPTNELLTLLIRARELGTARPG